MKTKITLMALTFGLLLAAPVAVRAEDTKPDAKAKCEAGAKDKKHRGHAAMKRVLTPEERQKLKTVHEQVLAANPALAAERDALKAERKAARANKGEGTDLIALHEKAKAFRAKLADAMVAADPSVKDILQKIEGARHRKGKA